MDSSLLSLSIFLPFLDFFGKVASAQLHPPLIPRPPHLRKGLWSQADYFFLSVSLCLVGFSLLHWILTNPQPHDIRFHPTLVLGYHLHERLNCFLLHFGIFPLLLPSYHDPNFFLISSEFALRWSRFYLGVSNLLDIFWLDISDA